MNISATDIEKYLRLSDTDYREAISALISPVANLLMAKCNNYFEMSTDQVYIESTEVDFYNDAPMRISCPNDAVYSSGFRDGMDIRIQNSAFNDGIYTVETADDNDFYLANGEKLVDEINSDTTLNRSIYITVVKIPDAFKIVLAKFIGEDLKYTPVEDRVQSERVGNTNFSYGNYQYGEYPDGFWKLLKPFMRPSLG